MKFSFFFNVFVFFWFINTPAFCQKEGYIWYFGNNIGIDFNSNPPKPLYDSKMKYYDEPVTMSDVCGHLLYYSDGKTVWNRFHEVMKNGDTLIDGFIAGQIVTVPYQDSLYILASIKALSLDYPFTNEIRYAIINMKGDNGKGKVISKQNLLYQNNSAALGGVKHSNGKDYWIVSAEGRTNKIRAFLVNENGLQTPPVVSQGGGVFTYNGILRLSPDGKKILNSIESKSPQENYPLSLSYFDNSTGKISSSFSFPAPDGHTGISEGSEFSPDSQKMYVPSGNSGSDVTIYQYQIEGRTTAQDIIKTSYAITASTGESTGLRLAPDGRIYFTRNTTNGIDLIINPNAIGNQLQFKKFGFLFNKQIIVGALSNNVAGYVLGKQLSFQPNPQCQGNSVTFTPQVNYTVIKWFWNFGDPASGAANTSTAQNPAHVFSKSGTYSVSMVTLNRCQEYDTLFKAVTIYPDPLLNLPDTLTACYTKLPLSLSVQAYDGTRYHWNTGDTTLTTQATKSGWYSATAYNPCRSRSDSIFVNILPEAIATIPDDTVFCEGNFKVLDARNPGSTYRWNTGETTRTIQINHPGKYFVEIKGACNAVTDTARVFFIPEDVSAFIPNLFTPNGDGLNEKFESYVLNSPAYSLTVYNRWGEQVFFTRNYEERWTGANQVGGTYYYAVTSVDCKGNSIKFKGFVQLLR